MKRKKYKVKLNTEHLQSLREAINTHVQFSIDKIDKINKGKSNVEYYAWDRICAIMDRLDDTVEYINMRELGQCISLRSAFDFYEFVNNAYIVKDCIDALAKIFNIDGTLLKNIELSTDCFKQIGDGTGNDESFFSYIRSLTSVHPITTNRQNAYLNGNVLHCCPFVLWANTPAGCLCDDNRDLTVMIYNSEPKENPIDIPLYLVDFETYINKWLSLLPIIINKIKTDQSLKLQDFINRKIKQPEEFNNYVEYIKNLAIETNERYGDCWEYEAKSIINVFELKLSNKENQDKFNKYKNALKYSIQFYHNSLQNMTSNGFINNGISDEGYNSLLDKVLFPRRNNYENSMYHYSISKVNYLNYDTEYYNKEWAYTQIKELMPLLSKYINFENANGDIEYYVLVQVALYFDCLDHKCDLNNSIPNTLEYRERLLN